MSPLRILVADDELLNRTLIERILTSHGHVVFTAEDGGIALDVAEREKPDVILLDLSMPTMDGLEVLRIIRTGGRDISPDTPVVVLTGFDRSEVAPACGEFGVADIMTKPVSMEQLFCMVRGLMERREGR